MIQYANNGSPAPTINFDEFRLVNDGYALEVKKVPTRISVKKPDKMMFFRTHQEFRFPTETLSLPEQSETYLVTRVISDILPGLVRPVMLHMAIDRQNNVSLIPVPLAGPTGVRNSWHESLAQAVLMAETKWLRIVANHPIAGYDALVAQGSLPDPIWPESSPQELLKIAFRDRIINDPAHPVVQSLLGST
jgi:hypothetical protein